MQSEFWQSLFSAEYYMWLLQNIWKPLIEILLISSAIYIIFRLIQGTRTAQLVKGLAIILAVAFLARLFELHTINWLLTRVFAFSVIAFLIIFQPELRRALAKIGQNPLFGSMLTEGTVVSELSKSVSFLSKKMIGALIVIEQNIGLGNYIESGVNLDSQVSGELLTSIFMPTTPLHDGAVVIQADRIAAAGCLLPLSDQETHQRMGTRHRAAMGISEETDALAIVVSEETGVISIVSDGKISRDVDAESLPKLLNKFLSMPKPDPGSRS